MKVGYIKLQCDVFMFHPFRRLYLENVCYHSVQNSSCLLSKNEKITTHNIVGDVYELLVWVWNLVSYVKGCFWTGCLGEYLDRGSDSRLQKIVQWDTPLHIIRWYNQGVWDGWGM
jgi:hypothetical protein